MRSPRRIFRSSIAARPSRVGRTMLAWALGAVGLVAVTMLGQSSDLFGSAVPGPDRLHAEPRDVVVVGGDTLRLGNQVVRLAGIEAPNRGDTCKGGTDCGVAAASSLAGLVRDRRVECRLTGRDAMGRPYGSCDAGGVDLSSAVVSSGWARAEKTSPALSGLEQRARQQGAGLWADTSRL